MQLDRPTLNFTLRVHLAAACMGCCFLIIGVRLWYLQILQGSYFRDKSENNRLQTVFIPPPRGEIMDRNGEILVNNRPAFNIELVSEDTPNIKGTLAELARVVNADTESLQQKLNSQRRRKFEPKLLLKDVSREIVGRVSAAMHRLPGVIITVIPARRYLFDDLGAHILGYIREITTKQLESPSYPGYLLGDVIGQYGIEAKWERYLQGSRGRKRVVVNAVGTRVGELSYDREVSGGTLHLTIDKVVQEAADNALREQRGAIVAIDPRNGEIRALASSERFDPNVFIGELSSSDWQQIMAGRRLHNRAVQGIYPPGSTFKIFTAIASLSEGIFDPKDSVGCSGGYFFAGRRYGCWKKTGHGTVNLHRSIVESCDTYYYIVGQRLGVDRIHKYASMFGLGERTGIDLVDENPGILPSTEWKRKAHRKPEDKKWYPGETLSVSIGQGAVSVTPLQLATAYAAVVNGGIRYQPRLVSRVVAADGRVIVDKSEPVVVGQADVKPEILALVKEGLIGVVNGAGGTARRARLDPELEVTVGGKTGTAQVAALHFGTSGELNDHAWFAGYAGAENPELVVVALAENGGHGGAVAAPIVRQVMDAYFRFVKKMPPAPPTDKQVQQTQE
jgi:penicillin-binding protein 2